MHGDHRRSHDADHDADHDAERERIAGGCTLLRPLAPGDLRLLQRWNTDPEILRWVGDKFARAGDPRRWLRDLLGSPRRRGYAIEQPPGRMIGDLELEDIDWSRGSAELRVCIGDKRLWGRGLGSDAVRAVIRHAFRRLRLSHVYLRVQLSNWRAIRCYQNCGFVVEGVLPPGRRRSQRRHTLVLMRLDSDPRAG